PVVPLRHRRSLLPSLLKSRCPTIAQGLAAAPSEPPPITLVPLTSQFTTCPFVVLYQRMSLLPSALKSCDRSFTTVRVAVAAAPSGASVDVTVLVELNLGPVVAAVMLTEKVQLPLGERVPLLKLIVLPPGIEV